jgi:hypothetical protein
METFPFLSTKNLQFAQQISHDDFFYIRKQRLRLVQNLTVLLASSYLSEFLKIRCRAVKMILCIKFRMNLVQKCGKWKHPLTACSFGHHDIEMGYDCTWCFGVLKVGGVSG